MNRGIRVATVLLATSFLIAAAFAFGAAAQATSFTVSPWAYACSVTTTANPAVATDPGATCDHNGSAAGVGTGYCAGDDTPGTATASYTGGTLTLSKNGPTCDDMASGATIGGLIHVTAISYDVSGYCGAGAPRINITTSDTKTHFFGCAANNSSGHVTVNLTAAGDGSGNGGVSPTDTITAMEFVFDEGCVPVGDCNTATAMITNLTIVGTATPTPSPSPTATPTATPAATPAPALPNASGDGS